MLKQYDLGVFVGVVTGDSAQDNLTRLALARAEFQACLGLKKVAAAKAVATQGTTTIPLLEE